MPDNSSLNSAPSSKGASLAPTSLGLGVFDKVATGLLGEWSARNASERALSTSKELAKYQFGLQREANRQAMSDKRRSLERAGLNLNSEQGFTPAVSAPGATQSPVKGDVPGSMDMSSLMYASQADLQQAQARLADANAQRILYDLNKDKSGDSVLLNNVTQDENGNLLITLPVISNTKQFEVLQSIQRWNGEKIAIDAKVSQDKLAQAIAKGQLEDNEFIQACIKLKKEEYNKLLQDIVQSKAYTELLRSQKASEDERKNLIKAQTDTEKENKNLVKAKTDTEKENKEFVKAKTDTEKENKKLVISNTALSDLQHTLQGNNDFSTVFSKMEGKDFGDKVILFLGWVFNQVTSMVSLGKHF